MNDALKELKSTVQTSTEMRYQSPLTETVHITFKDEIPQYEYAGSDSKRRVGTYDVDVEANKSKIQHIVDSSDGKLTIEEKEENTWTISYAI